MTNPKPWSLWLLMPLALLGIPVIGILLVGGLPHPPSTNGSVVGLMLFPFLAAGIIAFAALRAQPGGKRLMFVLLAGCNTLLWCLLLFVGMLAP